MIQAVVFDMDGLMFDTERVMLEAWSYAGKQIGYSGLECTACQVLGMTKDMARQVFIHELGENFPFDEMIRLGAVYRHTYLQKNGVPLKPGLLELLNYLRKNKIHAAVATSTFQKTAVPLLEAAGVLSFFQCVICGDALTRSKPEPDIYLHAAAMLKLNPQECMALEDSPNGIRSASGAGMKTVMIPDLIPWDKELDVFLFACVENLLGVVPLLQV